jgi:hypothetical protein
MCIPRDDNDLIKSFVYNDIDNIAIFLEEYGIVVINNILQPIQIKKSIDSIWNHDELITRGVDRDDIATWERNWPINGQIEKKGWISIGDDMLCKVGWENRMNSKLNYVFQQIWNKKLNTNVELCVKKDRYSVMRPILNKNWSTHDGWLHTDQNPATEKDFIRLQGVLTFTDSTENSGGGFICIPKFHKKWKKYCDMNPSDNSVAEYKECFKTHDVEKIFVKKGSLIIWDSRIPHANFPNKSIINFRFAQYITYYPKKYNSKKKKRILKEDYEYIISKLGNDFFTKKQIEKIF